MMGLIADIVQAAQGGRSASPAFFPYKKEPVSTHSHTGPDCLQQSHSLRECTSLACSADEPDGLSYSTGKILTEKTAILCLHDPTLALAYCDILLLLKDGTLIHTLHPKTDPVSVMEQAFSEIYGEVRLVPLPDPSKCAGNRLVLLPVL